MKIIKKFPQIILVAIFLSSCMKSIKKDEPIENLKKNINESANYITSKHSKKNLLVDFFHRETHPSKKIVTIPDSVLIYKKLLKSN